MYVHIWGSPAKENYIPENPPKRREEIYEVTGRRKSANVLSLTPLTARDLDGRIPLYIWRLVFLASQMPTPQ